MKTPTIILAITCLCLSCNGKKESLIRPEASDEIAINVGKQEKDRFLADSLEIEMALAEGWRKTLSRAETPAEVALAQESLRLANDEVSKIMREMEENR